MARRAREPARRARHADPVQQGARGGVLAAVEGDRHAPGAARLLRLRAAAARLFAVAVLLASATDDEETPPSRGPRRVWIAPNLGSEDLLDLFRQPELWPEARRNVDVLQLYTQHLTSRARECPECGRNLRAGFQDARAFDRLAEWHLPLAIETSALKEWGCRARPHVAQLRSAVRVARDVGWIVLDEPLLGAQACGLSVERAAAEVAEVVKAARDMAPEASVGLVEPWPTFSIREIDAWLTALEAQGAPLDFLHLDVDRRYARERRLPVADGLRQATRISRRHGLAFGVVFWADAPDETAYTREVLDWTRTVVDAIGWPEHAVFQSWAQAPDGTRRVPPNLPEDHPGTHTRLLLDALRGR